MDTNAPETWEEGAGTHLDRAPPSRIRGLPGWACSGRRLHLREGHPVSPPNFISLVLDHCVHLPKHVLRFPVVFQFFDFLFLHVRPDIRLSVPRLHSSADRMKPGKALDE